MKHIPFILMGFVGGIALFSIIIHKSIMVDDIFIDTSYNYLNDYKISLPEEMTVKTGETLTETDYLIMYKDHDTKEIRLELSDLKYSYQLTVDKLGISIYSGYRLVDQVHWDSTHLIKDIILKDNE